MKSGFIYSVLIIARTKLTLTTFLIIMMGFSYHTIKFFLSVIRGWFEGWVLLLSPCGWKQGNAEDITTSRSLHLYLQVLNIFQSSNQGTKWEWWQCKLRKLVFILWNQNMIWYQKKQPTSWERLLSPYELRLLQGIQLVFYCWETNQ